MSDASTEGTVSSLHAGRWYAKPYLLVTAAVVLAAATAGSALWWHQHVRKQQAAKVATTVALTNTATESGDYRSAYNALKEAEKQAKTTPEKVRVYGELAAAASNNGEIGQAIDYYNERHRLDPSTSKADAYLLGVLYERSGNKAKAIEQYKLAIEYYKSLPQNMQVTNDLGGLEAQLKDLEARQ